MGKSNLLDYCRLRKRVLFEVKEGWSSITTARGREEESYVRFPFVH